LDALKYLDTFLEETGEQLQLLERAFIRLEKEGFDEEELSNAYRAVHTLKGNSNMLGIGPMGELAHALEDTFERLLEGKAAPGQAPLSALLECSDALRQMAAEIGRDKALGPTWSAVVARLKEGLERTPAKAPAGTTAPGPPGADSWPGQEAALAKALGEGQNVFKVTVNFVEGLRFRKWRFTHLCREVSRKGRILASDPPEAEVTDETCEARLLWASAEPEGALKAAISGVAGIGAVFLCRLGTATTPQKSGGGHAPPVPAGRAPGNAPLPPPPPPPPSQGAEAAHRAGRADTVRVKSRHLDHLMDLVGEILINSTRVNKLAAHSRDRELDQSLNVVSRLVGELQDTVLRMRMVPVDYIFQRYPRMVRDMQRELGKDIDFRIAGNEIEVDRGLLDNIGDALIHALRNAVDHGIEPQSERVAAGKEARGAVTLSAFVEHNYVVITVEDDGRGLDPERLRRKAVEKGLLTAEDAAGLDEAGSIELAFRPGVSTAGKVSDISGRGMGLDIIKTTIESLGGTARLESRRGVGTKLTIRLPPSMSIIKAMLVEINGQCYAVPLENLRETVMIPAGRVCGFGDKAIFQLRDEIIPVTNLPLVFGGRDAGREELPSLVVEKDDKKAALVVGRLIGQQDIVVKGLDRSLRRTQCFSGATILGDGKVALILDMGAVI